MKYFVFILLIAISCSKKNKIESKDNDSKITHFISNEINRVVIKSSDFNLFYSRFISDSVFQRQHIRFPLKGGVNECDSTIVLTSENWHFISDDIRKKQTDIDSTTLIESDSRIYYIGHRKEIGSIIEMEFKKINQKWFLIYYELNVC